MRRSRTGALVAVVAMVVAGCGGGGGGATTSSSLTRAQLRTRADAICTRLNDRTTRVLNAANNAGGPNQSKAERRAYARMVDATVGFLREAADQMAQLDPPAAARATFKRFTLALRHVADGFPTVAETMAYKDPRPRLRDDERIKVRDLAQSLGFQVCG